MSSLRNSSAVIAMHFKNYTFYCLSRISEIRIDSLIFYLSNLESYHSDHYCLSIWQILEYIQFAEWFEFVRAFKFSWLSCITEEWSYVKRAPVKNVESVFISVHMLWANIWYASKGSSFNACYLFCMCRGAWCMAGNLVSECTYKYCVLLLFLLFAK